MEERNLVRHPQVSSLFRNDWISVVLAALLIVLYAVWIGYQWRRDALHDFNLYYLASVGFRRSMDVYSMARGYGTLNAPQWAALADESGIVHYSPPYRYPPLTAQIVLPLTLLDPRWAGTVWLVLTAAAFVVSAWLMGTISTLHDGRALAFVLMLVFVPTLTTMHAGQINGLVLLALVISMMGLTKRSALAAGAGIAVSSLLKLVPIALLFYLFWRRQWRAGFISIATLLMLMLTVPITFSADVLPKYLAHFLVMGEPGRLFAMPPNQSLSGVLARLLEGVLSEPTIYTLYLISSVTVVLLVIALCWPMRPLPPYWRYEYALIICSLQMITPYAWYHQLVLLFIPLVVVVERLWQRERWIWLGGVLMLFVLSNVHGLAWHHFESNRWLTSFPFVFNGLLWISLAHFILAARRSQTSLHYQRMGVSAAYQDYP